MYRNSTYQMRCARLPGAGSEWARLTRKLDELRYLHRLQRFY